jgi:hypothetical protein
MVIFSTTLEPTRGGSSPGRRVRRPSLRNTLLTALQFFAEQHHKWWDGILWLLLHIIRCLLRSILGFDCLHQLVTMASTKGDTKVGTPDSPTNPLLSDQDSRPPTSSSTEQDASASSSIRGPTTERPLTAANSVGTKQAGSTSTESRTRSIDQGQQPKSPRSSSKGPKDSPTKDIQLLSEDPFASEQSKALFDTIDELRICGAGQDLDLPQVSHCGS